jgi:hypothetical protein
MIDPDAMTVKANIVRAENDKNILDIFFIIFSPNFIQLEIISDFENNSTPETCSRVLLMVFE